MRGKIALFVILAPGNGEADAVQRRARRRCGHRPACQAAFAPGDEAIMIGPPGRQPGHRALHGKAHHGPRPSPPPLNDGFEIILFGDFPFDLDRLRRHAVADGEGIGREPRPYDEAVGRGLAARDAQLERIGREYRVRQRRTRQRQRKRGDRARAEASQHMAPRQIEARPAKAIGHSLIPPQKE